LFSVGTAGAVALLHVVELTCSHHTRFWSPDGTQAVVVSFVGQGALGADNAKLYLRHRWSPLSTLIYNGEAGWDFSHGTLEWPECRWLDKSRLLIRHVGPGNCEPRAGSVTVLCEEVPSGR